jgi:hypothetical protein
MARSYTIWRSALRARVSPSHLHGADRVRHDAAFAPKRTFRADDDTSSVEVGLRLMGLFLARAFIIRGQYAEERLRIGIRRLFASERMVA